MLSANDISFSVPKNAHRSILKTSLTTHLSALLLLAAAAAFQMWAASVCYGLGIRSQIQIQIQIRKRFGYKRWPKDTRTRSRTSGAKPVPGKIKSCAQTSPTQLLCWPSRSFGSRGLEAASGRGGPGVLKYTKAKFSRSMHGEKRSSGFKKFKSEICITL